MIKSARFVAFMSVSRAPMRRPAGQPVRVTPVSPAPMQRPVWQPVRRAADFAWCARALQALQQACRAFKLRYGPELQRQFGLVVHCTYKHETASQQHDPQNWTVPSNGRRSRCMITFDVALGNLTSTQCQVRCLDIGRGVALPKTLSNSTTTAEGSSKGN